MSPIYQDRMPTTRQGFKMGLTLEHQEEKALGAKKGLIIFEMRDTKSDEKLAHWEKENIITLDAGILLARLSKDSQFPNQGLNNGMTMLTIGTGATGNLLSPDAPQRTQRKLNNEISRKAFSSTQFRNADGVAVAYPTNILDLTTTFGEAEAVGPLNEMGIISAYSSNPEVRNPINNGPNNYDPTIDVSQKDLMANYLTFSVVTKPSTAVVTITWRLTF